MSELSLLSNGRFLEDLSDWTASAGAAFSVGDGDEHYGVAVLPTGDSIEQEFTVDFARNYSLHLALKSTEALTAGKVTATFLDENGNTLIALQPTSTVVSTWAENVLLIGLVPGMAYTLSIKNVSAAADVKVDDVWLWFCPVSRTQIAAQVHAKLGRLATQRSLSTTPSGALTEGDYTYSVDAALRAVDAIDTETGLPDIRCLEPGDINAVLDEVEAQMLERLQRDYAAEVDIRVGPRSESRSQIAEAIAAGLSARTATGGGRIEVRKLTHESLEE